MREELQWAERGAEEPRERQRHTATPRFLRLLFPLPSSALFRPSLIFPSPLKLHLICEKRKVKK